MLESPLQTAGMAVTLAQVPNLATLQLPHSNCHIKLRGLVIYLKVQFWLLKTGTS